MLEDSSNPWKRLCQDLHTVPTLLQDMQGIIFRDIINESNEPSVGSSDARYALSQAEKRRELREKLDKTVEMMKVIVKELIDSGGLLPHFIFRLSDEGFITPDNQLSSAEYRRKLLLSRLAMKVSIRLDGKLISSTGFYPLSSTFTVNFRSAFEFRLLHQPQNLMIEVHMGKLEVLEYKDVLVSTVAIPFPGQSIDSRPIPTQAFLPLSNWYSFSSIPGAPANSYSLACDGIMVSSYLIPADVDTSTRLKL